MHACDQLSPSHCNPMDCSLPGSSVHGFFPGKNIGMEMPFSPPGDLPDASVELTYVSFLQHLMQWQAESLPLSHLGSPVNLLIMTLVYYYRSAYPRNFNSLVFHLLKYYIKLYSTFLTMHGLIRTLNIYLPYPNIYCYFMY